ncbi:MAG: excinuclease ABC subunit UvrA, partial [Longimicrobiales bacterium]
MKDRISIRNARQHNLKGIDLELPRRALVVLTGPSGSGKSSLAFDTLYAEGQRRYVESLSTYAKQFLERMEKPAVDAVEGISPAVAIEQKNPTKTSRSTVGTATEVHDYLRLLWARAGRTHCPRCDRRVRPDTVQSATDAVLALPADTRLLIAFPLPRSARLSHARVVENLKALGFMRVLVGERTIDLDDPTAERAESLGIDLAGAEELLVVVDRLVVEPGIKERLADSFTTAFAEGEGNVLTINASTYERTRFSDRFHCPEHPDVRFLEPTPRLFSFNNPYGSCPKCTGFGATLEYDPRLIVPNEGRSLKAGAVDPWEKPRYARYRSRLLAFAKKQGVPLNAPWRELPQKFRDTVVYGARALAGVIPFLRAREEKRYKQYIRVFLRRYQSALTCTDCHGAKLRPEALYVRVDAMTIAQASELPIDALAARIERLARHDEQVLTPQEHAIAEPILRELRVRLRFLVDVGLGYLTLNRQTRTLSGGEAQRIALANSLGSSLVDTLYVLDEPTIGLHPRDTDRLLTLLRRLRDGGNSVLLVEHDEAAIRAADHLVELGPGSGEKGGRIVFQGNVQQLLASDTATARHLNHLDRAAAKPRLVRTMVPRIKLTGATLHNLQDVNLELPLGSLTVVTGVSGSGKSTLVHDVL